MFAGNGLMYKISKKKKKKVGKGMARIREHKEHKRPRISRGQWQDD